MRNRSGHRFYGFSVLRVFVAGGFVAVTGGAGKVGAT
jgi:hypothetical protein